MEEVKIDLTETKAKWTSPDLFVLSAKKTLGGIVEADYEDTRYTNPIGSP